ncbi:ImmA/IrrE family metallo-endopeptidase [Flexibacterium corallicola]|uniref:ImmA/IrrE family metallo-endopeptidase n=1 Tax=Flexibacterium corallicola TaxID=3037259 RepID=UPI00286ED9DD|nr:ImmA/IrrE family metallo-endopeptidase [Pseudovibrio sp. M1P-2-3]
MTSTVAKGNELENKFYKYLRDQQDRGDLVYGAYPGELCKIHKKKKYLCNFRGGEVEFDVVLEIYAKGRTSPQIYVVFECKNYGNSIPEIEVNDFSHKLERIFKHAVKGVFVVSTRLQSGAEHVVRNSRIGIVKYDEHGFEVVSDRTGNTCLERGYVGSQIFSNVNQPNPLKFSAYYGGSFFGSLNHFLGAIISNKPIDDGLESKRINIPYVSFDDLNTSAQYLLEVIDYFDGDVDLKKICATLNIDLQCSKEKITNNYGNPILGSANFDQKTIKINFHKNKERKRFTIAHEIGHFYMQHDRYLRSETHIENDLLLDSDRENEFHYERLEYQANTFASCLLLPEKSFLRKIEEYRAGLDIKNRGHGYIYVDDQPCNYTIYKLFLTQLKLHFKVSEQAIEIKLKKMGLLNDQRAFSLAKL